MDGLLVLNGAARFLVLNHELRGKRVERIPRRELNGLRFRNFG